MTTTDRHTRETREAAHWWARLGTRSSREIRREEREEFTQWLRESPLHVAEMLHMARVHDALERFKSWGEIQSASTSENENVLPLRSVNDQTSVADNAAAENSRRDSRRKRFAAFGAAAAAAVIVVTVIVSRALTPTIATDRAERREVVLSDGSVVQLDPETVLRIRLSAHERRLILSQGRALFEVAKDPRRPFLVVVNDSVVRAVGTVFGVERRNGSMVVTVSEGKVAVLPPSAVAFKQAMDDSKRAKQGGISSNPAQAVGDAGVATATNERGDAAGQGGDKDLERLVYLAAGEQLMVDSSGMTAPHAVDTKRALAWVEGRLVFESTPLSEVVEQFNRYNQIQLHVNGAELARRPISGVFEASDVATLIAFVQAGASVNVVRKNGNEILISAAP